MKKFIPSVLLVALFLALGALLVTSSSGCKSVPQTTVTNGVTNTVIVSELDPVRTSDAIRAVVGTAVPFAIQKDTNSVAYFRAAAVILSVAANNGNYDPASLQASLDHISVKELRTPEAKSAINAAFGIYRA